MVTDEMLNEIKQLFCNDARVMIEGGLTYIHLPELKLPKGNSPISCEGLLSLQRRDQYPTRLFLSAPVAGKGSNWTIHHILGKPWHTISWNYVEFTGRPIDVLAQHLRAFK
jgi:hypothetical protein